jgi:hypothetical protein
MKNVEPDTEKVDIEKGLVDAIVDITDLKKENQKLKQQLNLQGVALKETSEMLSMQTKLVVSLELEKIEYKRKIEELHEIIKTLTKNKLPCNPDHNGECLVCDCWLSDCPLQNK